MGILRRLNRAGEDRRISQLSSQSLAPPSWNITTDANTLRFMLSVKHEFTAERCKYDEFKEILGKFSDGSIAREDVISRMKVLFDGHHDLILAFNEFLPEGYKINIEDGEEVA